MSLPAKYAAKKENHLLKPIFREESYEKKYVLNKLVFTIYYSDIPHSGTERTWGHRRRNKSVGNLESTSEVKKLKNGLFMRVFTLEITSL